MENKELDLLFIEKSVLEQVDKFFKESDSKLRAEVTTDHMLLPIGAMVEKKKNEVKEMIKSVNHEVELKTEKAKEAINKYKAQYLDTQELEDLNRDLEKFYRNIENLDEKSLQNQLSASGDELENNSFQKLLGISSTTLYYFYKIGYSLFSDKLYEEAAAIFYFNVLLNPLIKDYWMAFGMAEKANGQYESALEALQMASIMDEEDLEPLIQLIEIYIIQQNFNTAEEKQAEAQQRMQNLCDPLLWQERLEELCIKINNMKNNEV